MRHEPCSPTNRPPATSRQLRVSLAVVPAILLIVIVWAYILMGDINGPSVSAGQLVPMSTVDSSGTLSCATPAAEMVPVCDAQEQKILASTVRLMFLGPDPVNIGHGTVVGGRYVLTHNHYPSFQPGRVGDGRNATHISVALANGEFILQNVPLSSYAVVPLDPGTLLLDFQTIDGIGFFDHLGIPSAPVAVWNSFAIQPGSEVAQVNWDGETTFVQWARVSTIRDTGSTPALELENFIELGASGGGVYYAGYHIGNNWLQGMIYHTDTQELARRYSVATTNDARFINIATP